MLTKAEDALKAEPVGELELKRDQTAFGRIQRYWRQIIQLS
jgi:hypothetical protein